MTSRKNEKNGSTVATTYEYQFPQPKEKVPFAQLICNPKEGTFFGRDASSWYDDPDRNNCPTTYSTAKTYGTFKRNDDDKFKDERIGEGKFDSSESSAKILLFYFIFYAVLAGLFAICMQALFASLDDKEPKWKLDSSLIGTNPGLGYRPLGRETERGAIIDFDSSKNETQQYWIDIIDEFLQPYYNNTLLKNNGRKQKMCDFDNNNKNKDKNDYVCAVDVSKFGDCSKKNNYGYSTNKPCVFLKLNKIFNWIPEVYEDKNNLPEDMPKDLLDYIKSLTPNKLQQVWVSCRGLHGHDLDGIHSIVFPSDHGFPIYYYPFKNQDDYLSPIIPVQIILNNNATNSLINIECRAWAKNIIYSGSLRDRKGSVTFQILIDAQK